jgi:hypothetical protein
LLWASIVFIGLPGTSGATEYWLSAQVLTKTMPDAQVITMWGFGQCAANFAACSPATVPGPELIVPPGDSTLTIHLRNDLIGPYVEPVSIIIPGQLAIMTPVWINLPTGAVTSTGSRNPGDVSSRMRSLTHETAPGATGVYTWNNVNPGTYLYRSGTHQAVQVQMGLYGALKKDFAARQAYGSATTAFDREVVLLFSEIDPILHAAIAAGAYDFKPTAPAGSLTSTIDFNPKYFLINGNAFSPAIPPILGGRVGLRTLLRIMNAGLRDYVPLLQGLHMTILAEDGKVLPYAKRQYSMYLPAGKTLDAIIQPAGVGNNPVYDRRLNLTNNTTSPGGMISYLNVVPAAMDNIGVFRNGAWYLDNGNGAWDGSITDVSLPSFGMSGDIPIAGDWNGTGKKKVGVFRNGEWFLDLNGNGAWDGCGTDGCVASFGQAGDIPIAGDWTGAGGAKIGVFRNGEWFLDLNGNGAWDGCGTDACYASFGQAGDIPIAGDWTGAGGAKIGVFRGGQWFLDLNGNGAWDGCGTDACYASFGVAADKPVAGAW